ncbi:DUF935 domain-containing protein [Kaustia mangrovi]|uniref:DUF935 domain-containing protein n=1 Tax=Kaustia mangrovi TaxID=2593653 RepID=A0A7S8HDB7_9HYPH|nr:DUF935 domain-containing protein [Kaustia mangrovi]QPC44506.1 DUF935 domain-containing protein [Kaustia mangrovi]
MADPVSPILGPDGRPVRRKLLMEPQAEPELTGIRSVWTEPVATGLTPDRLASILRRADEGDLHDFLILAEEIEEREPQYATVLGNRRRALTLIEPTVVAASDDKPDQEIADAVRELIARPDFAFALEDLTDALGKGFSAVEIVWGTEKGRWVPAEYRWREPWFFQFDRRTGKTVMLRDQGNPEGVALNPYGFMVHLARLKTGKPWRAGLARIAVWSFMLKGFSAKDWMAFLEVYGIPWRLGKYRSGATAEEKHTLMRAVRGIAGDAAAIVPEGMEIEILEASASRGSDAFEKKCRYLDEQVSKIVLGQTTTTDAISGGHAVSKEHQEVRRDIQKADARNLAATINAQLIEPFVAFNFGPQEVYPRVALPVPDPEDLKALMEATEKFVKLGGKVGMSVVRDKIGFEDPDEDEELLTPPGREPPAEDPQPAQARARHGSGCPVHGHTLAREMPEPDEIDELVEDELDEWEEIAAPLVEPIMKAVEEATSFEDLEERLKSAHPDGETLARRLAVLTTIARGLGDVSD